MPGRKYSATNSYRYGFNDKENDNDVKGEGNQQDYGMRIYDPRLGKFLSEDPIAREYPWYSPYHFAGNDPIRNLDLDGLEPSPYELHRARQKTNEMYANAKTPEERAYVEKMDRRGQWIAGGMFGASFFVAGATIYGTAILTTTLGVVTSPGVMATVASGTTITVRYGPDVVNFIYGATTGDALEPIPSNIGLQSSDAGVMFSKLFKAPVNIKSLLKEAGVEAAILTKGSKGGKVAVIGQGMDKIKQVAEVLKNAEVFTPSAGALKEWNKLLADNAGKQLSDDIVKGTQIFRENVEWIGKVKKEGYDVLDAGGGTTSTFYNMEKEAVYGKKK
jgi:RHS repeat-associated protein